LFWISPKRYRLLLLVCTSTHVGAARIITCAGFNYTAFTWVGASISHSSIWHLSTTTPPFPGSTLPHPTTSAPPSRWWTPELALAFLVSPHSLVRILIRLCQSAVSDSVPPPGRLATHADERVCSMRHQFPFKQRPWCNIQENIFVAPRETLPPMLKLLSLVVLFLGDPL